MNESLIMEIWDLFLEFIPEKSRDTVADRYIDFLVENDVTDATLESLIGNDDHLDSAIDSALQVMQEEEQNYYDDEEDY